MIVYFYSVDDEGNRISFHNQAHYEQNKIVFDDKSNENTKIYLSIFSGKVIIERKGNINMILELISGKKTNGHYQNDLGLEMDFITNCSDLSIKDKRIDISYDMILDNQVLSSHKLWIILR